MSTFVNDKCDNWVLIDIDSNRHFTGYYLKESVIRENHNIKVWVKRVYNQSNNIINSLKPDNNNYDIIHHSLLLYSFDYIDYKYYIESILHYNDNGDLLVNVKTFPKCIEIKPDSEVEFIFTPIIKRL